MGGEDAENYGRKTERNKKIIILKKAPSCPAILYYDHTVHTNTHVQNTYFCMSGVIMTKKKSDKY